MKKLLIIILIFISSKFLFPIESSTDYNNTKYLPRIIRAAVFEKYILNNITNEDDKNLILQYYYKDIAGVNYYLKTGQKKIDLLRLYNLIYSYKETHGLMAFEKAKVIHENEHPVFLQKGGMLRTKDNSFYFRTDDEWTGFTTFFLGYRYGVADYFNIAVEGGAGLPQVYIASILLHFKIYETPNKFFFIGLRARIGYKYQNAEHFMFSGDNGYLGLGKNYLTIQDRHSIYFAPDFTLALRFGRLKGNSIYYTMFPKIDFNLRGGTPYILLCPAMIGYEVRFGQNMEWSFATEAGYTFPIPWGSIPDGEWINFPSLANISVNYRFGDKFYSKQNREKIYNETTDDNDGVIKQ